MDVRSFFLGQSGFASAAQIREVIRQSVNFDPSVEKIADAEGLLIFQTSKQQTWLVATRARLYCVLDDAGKGFTKIQWSTPARQLVSGGSVVAPISTHSMNERTGLVDIGDHRNWYFSRALFTDESIEGRIRQMLLRSMG
jgi:hypothetical protein